MIITKEHLFQWNVEQVLERIKSDYSKEIKDYCGYSQSAAAYHGDNPNFEDWLNLHPEILGRYMLEQLNQNFDYKAQSTAKRGGALASNSLLEFVSNHLHAGIISSKIQSLGFVATLENVATVRYAMVANLLQKDEPYSMANLTAAIETAAHQVLGAGEPTFSVSKAIIENSKLTEMVIAENMTIKKFDKLFSDKGYQKVKGGQNAAGFYFRKPDGSTISLIPGFHRKGEILKYATGGGELGFSEAEKWWGNDLSLNEQKDYAKKHLLSFEYSELMGSTAQYSNYERWKKFITKIWEKEGRPKSVLPGLYATGGSVDANLDRAHGFGPTDMVKIKNIADKKLKELIRDAAEKSGLPVVFRFYDPDFEIIKYKNVFAIKISRPNNFFTINADYAKWFLVFWEARKNEKNIAIYYNIGRWFPKRVENAHSELIKQYGEIDVVEDIIEKATGGKMDFSLSEQKKWTENQSKMYDHYVNHSNGLVDLEEALTKAKNRKDTDEIKRLELKKKELKHSIRFIEENFHNEKATGGKMSDAQIEKLAKKFSKALENEIGKQNLLKVVAENKAETDSSICHSHDYCDANMVMDAALRAEGIRLEVPTSAADVKTWNKVWDAAKANIFFTTKLSKSDKEYNKEVDAYKWFVCDLDNKQVLSGYEFKTDAEDFSKEFTRKTVKVVHEKMLPKFGIENPKEKWKKLEKGGTPNSTEIVRNGLTVSAVRNGEVLKEYVAESETEADSFELQLKYEFNLNLNA